MAVTVRQLFKNAEQLYRAKLIAGEEGLDNLVEWVHIVEDSEVGLFLHGGELVFTTGIVDGSDEWLMDFAKNLHESQASAFVINLDVYIPVVPVELITYCNEIKMPLYTIPWETRQVDMTRDFCQKIIENENTETSELGIDKIIMAVENKNILKKYFDDTIGKLKLYDKENNSNLYDFLKEYLELDASPRAVSEKLFIHRNTVNNYLKKIDAVLGVESMDLEQKAKLLIAYHIADMLH